MNGKCDIVRMNKQNLNTDLFKTPHDPFRTDSPIQDVSTSSFDSDVFNFLILNMRFN